MLWLLNEGFAGGGVVAPSLPVFPSLPGQEFPVTRTMEHSTDVQRTVSGKTVRSMNMRWPRVHWTLSFSLLRDDGSVPLSELRQLMGFFNQMRGRAGSFLYTDGLFNSVIQMPFATGDGSTTTFQITATYQANSSSPGTPEIIQNFNTTASAPALQNNGTTVSTSSYSINSNGRVTFATAPVSGHVLSWTGAFYYQCVFDNDLLDFAEIANKWWEVQKLDFTSVVR